MLDEEDPAEEVPTILSTDKTPPYWKNQDLNSDFDVRVDCGSKDRQILQSLLDQSWRDITTRDRHGPTPTGLEVVAAHRVEDRAMWCAYLDQKRKIKESRGSCTPFHHLDGDETSGLVKTDLEGLCTINSADHVHACSFA